MKQEFQTDRIADIAEVQTGPFGSQLHNKDYVADGTPIVTVEHLGEKRFLTQNLPCVTDKDRERLSKYSLQKGDIVFSRVGSVDRCSFVSEEETGWLFSGRCLRVRPNSRMCIPEYLYYYLCSPRVKEQMRNIAVGATMPSINTKLLCEIPVSCPEIETQKKIAAILSSLDDKIEVNNQINRNLEEQAKAIFKSWQKQCMVQTTIGDIVSNILDYTPNLNSKVVLVNSSDVTKGVFEHHILSDNQNLKGHFKKRFKKFDILYSEIRPKNKHYAYVLFDTDQYIASTRLMVLRNKPEKISSSLLYQYLISDEVREKFTTSTETRSGTFPQGCFEDLARIAISLNPIEKQKEVTSILDCICYQIYCNHEENRHLCLLRDTLLPKLMSGEIEPSMINN